MKKKYFDVFSSKKHFKNNIHHTLKHALTACLLLRCVMIVLFKKLIFKIFKIIKYF
jgi:hypothetical protein